MYSAKPADTSLAGKHLTPTGYARMRPVSKIAETNDSFRRAAMKGIKSTDGKAVRTQGVAALGSLTNLFLQAQIAHAFTETNDPHGEHDRSQPSTRSPRQTTHTVNTTWEYPT